MSATFEQIIVDCIQQGLGLPRDPVDSAIRDLALSYCNEYGRILWDSWEWDNEKLDEFDAPAASSGIITFASNVDVIRAVRAVDSSAADNEGVRVFNEDERLASSYGVEIGSAVFHRLADSTTGCRRIKINEDDGTSTFRVLALKRWTDATVEDAYDEAAPTATPSDYRVLTFILDRAEPALRAYVKDALREWEGRPQTGTGDKLLALAVRRDVQAEDRERRAIPRYTNFDEVGDWGGI